MKQHSRKKSFDIYLPATAEKEAELVETIEVEVYEKFGEEFLTPESNELIERTRARHLGLMHGADIKALRKRLNLTQDQLSDRLGCGKKSLSRWESGRAYPSQLVNKLLRLLDEGFLAPASLEAVEGPRPAVGTSPFFTKTTHRVTNYDFSSARPTPSEVKALLSKTRQTILCQ
jgi:DNA-binding transcriptional regulator YiaG